jgi:predicted MFS family arabinose efflux permease
MSAPPRPAPAAPARLQLAAIVACFAAAGLWWGSFVATLPALQLRSGLSPADFGLALTAQAAGGIVAMQALGRILHRVQAVAIPACLGLFALGVTTVALAQGAPALVAGLAITGAASGALDISLNMRVARIEADLNLRLFNRVHALFPFVMLCASAATGLLRDTGATPEMLLIPVAALMLAAAGIEARAGRHQRPDPGGSAPRGRALTGTVVLLGLVAACGAAMEGGAHVWAAIYIERELAAGPALAGYAAAAITLGLTTGRLLAHRFEARVRAMTLVAGFACIAAPAFGLLALSDGPGLAILGYFLAGVGIGPIEPSVFRAVATRHAEAARGRALALATGVAYVGYLTAPPVLGGVIDGAGWAAMFAVLAGVALAAAGLSRLVPPARAA